jgi:PKD repeat protein
MVVVDGQVYTEGTMSLVTGSPRTWTYESGNIYIHFADGDPSAHTVEITTRRRIFAPHNYGYAYITVRGFTMQYAGNQSSSWYIDGAENNIAGDDINSAVGVEGGHHWIFEYNTIWHTKTTGLHIGDYSKGESWERYPSGSKRAAHNIVRYNNVSFHGMLGIGCYATKSVCEGMQIVGNWIEGNNHLLFGVMEEAGIKCHQLKNSIIADNMITNNWAAGIWLDWYCDDGNRITGNVFPPTNNGLSLYLEIGDVGTNLFDNNIVLEGANFIRNPGHWFDHNLIAGEVTSNTATWTNNLIVGSDGVTCTYDENQHTVTLTVTDWALSALESKPTQVQRDFFGPYSQAFRARGPFQSLQNGENVYRVWPKTLVLGGAPAAILHATTPTVGIAPLEVSFDAGESFDDGSVVSYAWDFGDGGTGNSATPSHTFTEPGDYVVTLTVTDNEGNTGTAMRVVSVLPLLPAVTVSGANAGLEYFYYEGAFSSIPDVAALTPLASGVVDSFDLSVRQVADFYVIRFEGYVEAPESGLYAFYTYANDAGILYIDGKEVVNSDGLHVPRVDSGYVALEAGKHAIVVDYMEVRANEFLEVSWQGPGFAKEPLPTGALFQTGGAPTVATAAATSVKPLTLALREGALDITIPTRGRYGVEILSPTGRVVWKERGFGPRTARARPLASGTYLVRVEHAGTVLTRRVLAVE